MEQAGGVVPRGQARWACGHRVDSTYTASGYCSGRCASIARLSRTPARRLRLAEQRGDDYALTAARLLRGFVLAQSDGPQRSEGFQLLALARDAMLEKQFMTGHVAADRSGNCQGKRTQSAISMAPSRCLRPLVDGDFATGYIIYLGAVSPPWSKHCWSVAPHADMAEAQTAIERLSAVPVEPGIRDVRH